MVFFFPLRRLVRALLLFKNPVEISYYILYVLQSHGLMVVTFLTPFVPRASFCVLSASGFRHLASKYVSSETSTCIRLIFPFFKAILCAFLTQLKLNGPHPLNALRAMFGEHLADMAECVLERVATSQLGSSQLVITPRAIS